MRARRPRPRRRSAARRRPRAPALPGGGRRGGRHRPAGGEPVGDQPVAEPGLGVRSAAPSSHSGATSGKRAASPARSRSSASPSSESTSTPTGPAGTRSRGRAPRRARASARERRSAPRRADAGARRSCGPRRPRRSPRARTGGTPRAGLGEQRRERRADDPAAGDRDVRRAHVAGSRSRRRAPGRARAPRRATARGGGQPARDRRGAALGGVRGDGRELEHGVALLRARRGAPERGREGFDPLLGGGRHAVENPSGGRRELLGGVDAEQRARRALAAPPGRARRAPRARAPRAPAPARSTGSAEARSVPGTGRRPAPPRRRRPRRAGVAAPRRRTACRTPPRSRVGPPARSSARTSPVSGCEGSSGSIHTGTSSGGSAVAGLGHDDRLQSRPRAPRPAATRRAAPAELEPGLRAAHAPAAPAGEHGHEGRRHPPTASGPSSLRSLTCSCSGENGVASRSSAPAAVDLAARLPARSRRAAAPSASRVSGVGAQRADRAAARPGRRRPVEDHQVRAAPRGRARPALAVRRLDRRRPGRRAPPAPPRACWRRRPPSSTRGRRAAAAASRIPSIAVADLVVRSPVAVTRLVAGLARRAAARTVSASGPAASITRAGGDDQVAAASGSGGRATCRAPWRSRASRPAAQLRAQRR